MPTGLGRSPPFVSGVHPQCRGERVKYPLPEIRHDHESFEALAGLHARTKDCYLEEIEIDLSETAYFEADMCAALGAILYRLGRQLNTVRLVGVTGEVAETLSKNGFLSHYGRAKLPDSWGAAVSYRRFDVRDDHHFSGYIERELIDRPGLPEMPPGLVKKFRESIFEIFSNAVLHSDTRLGIFSCGQYFPELERFDFMVTDLGVGMRRNIRDRMGRSLGSVDAIIWATEEHNTTKRAGVPGGLGLKLLGEFIEANGGCIRIASDGGYWQKKKTEVSTATLSHPFPGTVVSLEVKTSDAGAYRVASGVSVDDIF